MHILTSFRLAATVTLALSAQSWTAAQSEPNPTKSQSPIMDAGTWQGPGWYPLLKGSTSDSGKEYFLQDLDWPYPFDSEQECNAYLPKSPRYEKYSADLKCYYYTKPSEFSRQ